MAVEGVVDTTSQMHIFGTFGLYRYVLACLVIVNHVTGDTYDGASSVFGFFILSGYVVSYILHNRYLSLRHGVAKYILARMLRVYPLYWCVMGIGLMLAVHYPGHVMEIGPGLRYPGSLSSWLINITLISPSTLIGRIDSRILSVSWSLTTELFYWLLIPMLFVMPKMRWSFVAASLAFTAWEIMHFQNHKDVLAVRYFGIPAAGLPFCIGMLLFLRKVRGRFTIPWIIGVAAIGGLFWLGHFHTLFASPAFEGLYISVVLHSLAIGWLGQIDTLCLPVAIKAIDDWFGKLAYPIFLVHVPVLTVIHILYPNLQDWTLYQFCVGVSTIVAVCLHDVIEKPVEHLRRQLKC